MYARDKKEKASVSINKVFVNGTVYVSIIYLISHSDK